MQNKGELGKNDGGERGIGVIFGKLFWDKVDLQIGDAIIASDGFVDSIEQRPALNCNQKIISPSPGFDYLISTFQKW